MNKMNRNTELDYVSTESKSSRNFGGDTSVDIKATIDAQDALEINAILSTESKGYDVSMTNLQILAEEINKEQSMDIKDFNAPLSIENVKKLEYVTGFGDGHVDDLTYENITSDPSLTKVLSIEKKENIFKRVWEAVKKFFKSILEWGKKLITKLSGAFANIEKAAQKILDKQKDLGSIKAGAEFSSDEIKSMGDRLGGAIFMANDADLSSKKHLDVIKYYTKGIGNTSDDIFKNMQEQFVNKIVDAINATVHMKINPATGNPDQQYLEELIKHLSKDLTTPEGMLNMIGSSILLLRKKSFINNDQPALLSILDTDIKLPDDIKSVSGSPSVSFNKDSIGVIPYSVKGKNTINALVFTIPSDIQISDRDKKGTREEQIVATMTILLRYFKATPKALIIKNKLEIKKSEIMDNNAIEAIAGLIVEAGKNIKKFETDLIKKGETVSKIIEGTKAMASMDDRAHKVSKLMTNTLDILKPITKSFGIEVMSGYIGICTDYLYVCSISQEYYEES